MTSELRDGRLCRFCRDGYFAAAVMAGPLFWLVLYAHRNSPVNLAWPVDYPVRFLTVALIYPILEETFFRGWLQGKLWRTRLGRCKTYPLSVPNLVTSVIFTALHFLQHPPHWALSVLGPSLLFGYFRDKYTSVLPAAVLHVLYNSGYYLLFIR